MAAKNSELSPSQVDVWVSKAPILSPIHETVDGGCTLEDIYSRYSGLSRDHTKAQVNGEWVEDWSTVVNAGDSVLIVQLPRDPVTVAYVAIAISVVSMAASLLLFKPPEGPGSDERANRISGPRNKAAKYDPVPSILGKRQTTPPYAVPPYTDWAGNQEYLNMLLCVGIGPLSVTDVQIGDTPIEQYEEVSYEVVDSYNNSDYSSLLPVWKAGVIQENVSSELNFDSFITRTSAADAQAISFDIAWPQGLRGQTKHRGDAIEIQYQIGADWYIVARPRTEGSGYYLTGSLYKSGGSFYLIKPGSGDLFNGWEPAGSNLTDITSHVVYYDATTGITLIDPTTIPYRVNSVQAWAKTSAFFVRGFRLAPVDLSGNPIVGNVSFRLRKAIDEDLGSANDRKTAQWLSIKSEREFSLSTFLKSFGVSNDNPDFKPAIIALRVRATDQLNGVIDNLNCQVQSVVPVDWSKEWSSIDIATEPMKLSSNPAELYRWAIQGNASKIRTQNDKIDLVELEDWRDRCILEGWETSEYVNYEETLRKVLGNIAFTGRADFSYREGKFSVVQKIKRTTPKQIFTPKNSSNLKSRRDFPPNYDGIKFKFQNADREDQVDESTYYDPYKFANNDPTQPLAGVEVTGTFQTIEFWGVTGSALAQRHARFTLFEQKLRRETYELETDIEALVAERGDMVRIAHDVIDVGVGQGFIAQDVSASTTFFMDEERGAVVGDTHYFQVRQVSSGTVFSEFDATYQGNGEWISSSPQTLSRGDLAVYGELGKVSLDCIIVGIENRDDYAASLTLVNAANEIYDEDDAALPTYNTGLSPRADFVAPLVPVVNTSDSGYSYDQGFISVQVEKNPEETQQIQYFSLRYRTGDEGVLETVDDDGTVWNNAGIVASSDGEFRLPADKSLGVSYWVQVKAIAENMASIWSAEKNVVINADPSPDVNDFTITEQVNTPKTPDGQFSTLVIDVDEPASPAYLYAIAEYRLPGQPEWFEISRIGWEFSSTAQVQVFSDGIQYEIRVRTVNIFGVANETGISKLFTTTNVLDPEYTADNPFKELPAPNVSGLELFEQGNDTEFTGQNAKFTWRKSTLNDWLSIGYAGLKGADASQLDQYFRDYEVKIIADDRVVRTENVTDNAYIYSFEKNAEDYKRRYSVKGAYREFRISVIMRTRQNQVSPRISFLDVSNTAPDPLSALSVVPGFSVIEISYLRPDDLDFAGVDIWISETQGFDPDTTDPVATVSDNSYVISGLADGTLYYVRLRPFDLFGKTGTNTSAEFSVTTKTAQDLSGLSGWAYEINPLDRAFIQDNIEGGAIDLGDPVVGGQLGTAKLADLAVEAGKLAGSSVTATKIANLAVGTAAIDTAAVTNAKIANLAVGTAQIQDASIQSAKIGDLQVTNAKIVNLTAAKITAGVINATETITSEGLIRSVDNINTPQYQTGLGPLTIDGTTYLMWGYNAAGAAGDKLRFGIDELGNAYFRGDLEASSFTNAELTIDAAGNVTSTGTLRFGGASDNFISFNGTQLEIDTDNFSVDAAGNASFSGQLSAATGTFSGTLSAGTVTGGVINGATITGGTIRTAASGTRVEISGGTNTLKFYDGLSLVAAIGTTVSIGLNLFSPRFYADASSNDDAIMGIGNGTGAGIFGYTAGGSSSSYAINGWCSGTGVGVRGLGNTYGVKGESNNSVGVYGWSGAASGVGIKGVSTNNIGINGQGTSADFYANGSGTNYAPFTGAHDSLLPKSEFVEVGDIITTAGEFYKSGVSQTIPKVFISSGAMSKAVYGIFVNSYEINNWKPAGLSEFSDSEIDTLDSAYDVAMVNALGEGQVNLCDEGGDFEVGDFICTSNTPGKGMRYDGQDMRYVVAKCMENVNWQDEPSNIKMVACIYMCG